MLGGINGLWPCSWLWSGWESQCQPGKKAGVHSRSRASTSRCEIFLLRASYVRAGCSAMAGNATKFVSRKGRKAADALCTGISLRSRRLVGPSELGEAMSAEELQAHLCAIDRLGANAVSPDAVQYVRAIFDRELTAREAGKPVHAADPTRSIPRCFERASGAAAAGLFVLRESSIAPQWTPATAARVELEEGQGNGNTTTDRHGAERRQQGADFLDRRRWPGK